MDLVTQCLRHEWDLVCARDRQDAIARRWAAADPTLSTITSLFDILARCHDQEAPEAAHATFAALCRLAPKDELARLAVLRALVPAICSISARYGHYASPGSYFATYEEISAFVASSMSFRLLSSRDLGPRPVRRLMAYASWAVRTADQRQRTEPAAPTSWEEFDEDLAVAGDCRTGPELAAAAIRDGYRTGRLTAAGARILFRRNVLDENIDEIARAEGIHPSTVSRRHGQLIARAEQWACVA